MREPAMLRSELAWPPHPGASARGMPRPGNAARAQHSSGELHLLLAAFVGIACRVWGVWGWDPLCLQV